ncbi:MFS transporter [Blastococcus saxobsidens]|uniref:Major facilitator superfamily MFS_1 n=1 Tax=Blastococcus saxobsidens (strain DD2) TaxID=1146883 RepID=H6RQT0_BLASD|nr:MFS transporter [Blastococcus saxobsidens]CCG01607.1 Major facilitator superfamily MFS_1 [Blastococcus saxobsidens DD2]
MSAARRPPGAPRRSRLSRRAVPPAPDRLDTTPLGVPRPQTRPMPAATATPPLPGGPKVTVTRVAAARSRELTVAAARRVRAASRADGAAETGLAQLLWVNALHMAGDAMIAVSLAGTLFFAATTDAQRGNVALYLLVTMAPFALLAPVIGPALDRLQRGRRWALAVSLGGRAVLALVMAAHFDDLWLYPAALGVLVLSKAHNVLRAAVVPRVLPGAMSLTSANARLSVFGLATAGVAGGLAAGVAAFLGFDWELWATAAVFVSGAVLAVRLPRHVDVPTGEEPADVLTTTTEIPRPGRRRRRVSPHVVLALRANAALRGLGGFLTIFSAFLVQATFADGWEATLALGAIAAAAGAGSFAGTAVGSRLHTAAPDRLVLYAAGTAAAITVVAAVFYGFGMAVLVAGVAAVANALGKVSLDAIIQREVPESLRASAFARSETMLQLSWVAGGALGIALPPTGWLGFTVAAVLLGLAVALILWSLHRSRRPAAPAGPPELPTTPVGPSWS